MKKVGSAIALRYLFSKKGTNFINIISSMTIVGLSIGTAALIIVLSVFNGFEDLIASMVNTFNPDIKIVPRQGKFFDQDDVYDKLINLPEVEAVSCTIEETAFFEYDHTPTPGTLKGVDANFLLVNDIDSALVEGTFLEGGAEQGPQAVLGSGISRKLAVDVLNVFKTLSVYMARRTRTAVGKPFKERQLRPVGVFAIQQEIDNEYIFVDLDLARDLLGRPAMVSALEIRLSSETDQAAGKRAIQAIAGENLKVLDQYEQDEEFLKIMNLEKWMAFSIASLMLLLISFNLVGCLWMIVVDKKQDIAILRAMGGTSNFVRNVFMKLGLLYTSFGILVGLVLAIALYLLQINFGLISIPQGFVVDAYPIRMKLGDVIIVVATVFTIGWLASLPSSRRASATGASVRET